MDGPYGQRTVGNRAHDQMELIALILKVKVLLVAVFGTLGIVFAFVLAPFWLPFLVFGILALVSYAFYEEAKSDVRSARDKVRKSSRKVQEAEERLARERDRAILRAQREFEDVENSVEDFAFELENARNKVISDAESEFEKSKARVRGATKSVNSAEKELAQLQAPLPAPMEPASTGKLGVSVLLKHVRIPKRKLDDSWHEVKTKIAESKLENARDDLREVFEDIDEAADELELAKSHQSEATKRHEAKLEISKSDLVEVARMLDEAKAHRSERTKKHEDKLLKAEQKRRQEVEKLQRAQAKRMKMFVYFSISFLITVIPPAVGASLLIVSAFTE